LLQESLCDSEDSYKHKFQRFESKEKVKLIFFSIFPEFQEQHLQLYLHEYSRDPELSQIKYFSETSENRNEEKL
jgi:hypothetical protein